MAHWEWDEQRIQYVCSACKQIPTIGTGCAHNLDYLNEHYKFCRNCGERMGEDLKYEWKDPRKELPNLAVYGGDEGSTFYHSQRVLLLLTEDATKKYSEDEFDESKRYCLGRFAKVVRPDGTTSGEYIKVDSLDIYVKGTMTIDDVEKWCYLPQ